jgi:tetratricopeptide (TPR) repeat protein
MGNNEMVGPYGVNPISGPSAPTVGTVRLSLALRELKIGQWVESLAGRMRAEQQERGEWEGVKMFRERQVSPKDQRKELIHANFQANLEDILRVGIKGGAKPIVCTVASNLRDFAPLASIGTTNELFLAGVELQAEGRLQDAANAFELASQGMAEFADLAFRRGQVSMDLGESNAVTRTYFAQARDWDALPLRTSERLNEIIREVAGRFEAARVVDVDGKLGAAVAAGTVGDETFFDHVHFTFIGNYRAARIIAEQIESELPPEVTAKSAVNWASAGACERALGLTGWNRRAAYEHMLRRQMEPPFSDQSNHTNRVENMARLIAETREQLNGRAATNAMGIYEDALAKNTNDFRLRESYAEFLEAIGRTSAAAEQRKWVAGWVPHDSVAAYQAGRLLVNAQKPAEARTHLERALRLRPSFPEAQLEIGRAYSAEGAHESALNAYDKVLELRKDDAGAFMQKAHSYAAMGRRKEAKATLREAIRVRPDYWEPRYLLAIELAADGELAEAIVEFNEVTRLRPTYAPAYFNLSVALAKNGRLREAYLGFQKTLELDPNHKNAREYLGAMEREFGK